MKFKVGDVVVVKHQKELGVNKVTGYKHLKEPLHLPWHGKVVTGYVMVEGLGGYWEENLEVIGE